MLKLIGGEHWADTKLVDETGKEISLNHAKRITYSDGFPGGIPTVTVEFFVTSVEVKGEMLLRMLSKCDGEEPCKTREETKKSP